MADYSVYQVGKLYIPGKTHWPEAIEYNFRRGGHELRMFFPVPTETEIRNVRSGQAQFRFLMIGDIIMFLCKFGSQPWCDAPYSWWVLPGDEREDPPDIPDGQGIFLVIVLVDAATGVLKVIRTIGLQTEFSRRLHDAIYMQMKKQIDWAEYSRQVDQIYSRYTPDLLAESARSGQFLSGWCKI